MPDMIAKGGDIMKKCPFCAEEIQEEAIKCKHCQSMLTEKIKFKCIHCDSELAVDIEHAGKFIPCPNCEEDLQIPKIQKPPPQKINNGATEGQILENNKEKVQASAMAGIFSTIAVFLLIWGFFQYSGGSETRSMYQGTVLQNNAQVNTITSNFESAGLLKIEIGAGLLVFSGLMVAVGNRKKKEDKQP